MAILRTIVIQILTLTVMVRVGIMLITTPELLVNFIVILKINYSNYSNRYNRNDKKYDIHINKN